jgi:hypothetical protein
MKIEITRNVNIAGQPFEAGDPVEVDQSDANLLISLGKAIPFKAKKTEEEPATEEEPQAEVKTAKGKVKK